MKLKAALILALVLILSLYSVYAWSSFTSFSITTSYTSTSPNLKDTTSVATTDSRILTSSNLKEEVLIPNSKISIREPIELRYGNCFETDNGRDYEHAGTTYYLPRPSNWCRTQIEGALEQCRNMRIGNCLQYIPEECRPTAISDRCIDGYTLNEMYCSMGRIRQARHVCNNFCYANECY